MMMIIIMILIIMLKKQLFGFILLLTFCSMASITLMLSHFSLRAA